MLGAWWLFSKFDEEKKKEKEGVKKEREGLFRQMHRKRKRKQALAAKEGPCYFRSPGSRHQYRVCSVRDFFPARIVNKEIGIFKKQGSLNQQL